MKCVLLITHYVIIIHMTHALIPCYDLVNSEVLNFPENFISLTLGPREGEKSTKTMTGLGCAGSSQSDAWSLC